LVRTHPGVRYSILFYGAITVGSIAPVFFFQPFLVEHNFDVADVGFWQTPTRIAAIIGAVAAARIISSLGERGTFLAMPVMLLASYLLLGLWDSVYAQVAFPLMNFAVILSQPTVTDYLHRRVPSEQRATVVSLTNLIRSAVLIPAAPLLGALADESLETAFLVGAVIIGATSLPLLALWAPHLGGRREAGRLVAEPAAVAGD
jgi:predicted MFS family arabinose efflux permease